MRCISIHTIVLALASLSAEVQAQRILPILLAAVLGGHYVTAQEAASTRTPESETSPQDTTVQESTQPEPLLLRSQIAVADSREAWSRMPQEHPELPSWARALVEPLPKATAALLQLDYLHREKNPLGAELSGKLRWMAADAIDCDYARSYARTDLKRAGLSDEELELFTSDTSNLSESDRAISEFARHITLAAHEVTDQEMTHLIEMFGAEAVVGMVHTLAFANFENRLFLGLGVEVEPGGPLPPTQVHVDAGEQSGIPVPERMPPEELEAATTISESAIRLEWGQRDLSSLELSLNKQKNRSSRIPMPPLDRLDDLPPARKEHVTKVVWSRVSFGYQPELTQSWFNLMQMFHEDSQMDRVFANSVFWVVTRSNECFY